jgi:hypothetical protein
MRVKSSARRCGTWKTTTSARLPLAKPSAEDILTDLTEDQLEGFRRRVPTSIENIEAGKFVENDGREGLNLQLGEGERAQAPCPGSLWQMMLYRISRMLSKIWKRSSFIGPIERVWRLQIGSRSVSGYSENIQNAGDLHATSLRV